MLPRSVNSGNFDKFNMQDAVIERFRRFATEKLVPALVHTMSRIILQFGALDLTRLNLE
jgi:hypothetical protein